ncbi:MAG: YkvA family protein [Wenzhouxiangellaceae bacterium]|nr:YkvA family protein [Wenzhouxiangellaceae bacterium]
MTMRIVLDLSDKDLEHFRNLAKKALETSKKLSPDQIVAAARKLLTEVGDSDASDFIRERLDQVSVLIEMLEDEGWGMQEVGRKRVLAALAYFNQPEDLIPDYLPGIGFLDDAIMIELLSRELKPEIDAYQDFVQYRATEARRLGKLPEELNRSDYLQAREQALLSRMRRRRRAGRSAPGGSGKTPFSLF